jgi:endoglucanase
MDEIGLMVSHFSGNFVRFNTLGGWWPPRLVGLPVKVITRKGGIPGVVATKSPFLIDKEERDKPVKPKDMFIDVGLTGKKKPESLGIRPGDPVVPVFPFTVMPGGKTYMAKAWDDRLGCAVIVEVMRKLSDMSLPNCVYAVGTVQEEVGIRGAVTSGHAVSPDICFAIDVNIAQDIPGSPEEGAEKLGAGVSICVYDATLIPNTKLRDLVADIADRKKIPYTDPSERSGGPDTRDRDPDTLYTQRGRDRAQEGFRQRRKTLRRSDQGSRLKDGSRPVSAERREEGIDRCHCRSTTGTRAKKRSSSPFMRERSGSTSAA